MSVVERSRHWVEQHYQQAGRMVAVGLLGLTTACNPTYQHFPDLDAPPRITTPEQQNERVPHWDGTWKRKNTQPGHKFITIPGIRTTSRDPQGLPNDTFDRIKQEAIYRAGFDEHDVLDMTYRTNEKNELVGEHYGFEDSNQDPQKSLEHMKTMMKKYKRDFPNDKYVLLGHSQGGYLAYELARTFPDDIAIVMTFDGALAGADIVPTPADSLLAPMIGGQAAQYHIQRGARPAVKQEVERNITQLRQQKGMVFITFASTQDWIVSDRHAFISTSTQEVNGKKLQVRFAMEPWTESRTAKLINQHVTQELQRAQNLFPEQKVAGDSARMTQRRRELQLKVEGGTYGHMAAVYHPKVVDDVKFVIDRRVTPKTACNIPVFRYGETYKGMSEKEMLVHEENAGARLLNRLPYKGKRFSMHQDYSRAEYVIELSRSEFDEAKKELGEFLKRNNIASTEFIRNIVVICR